MKRPTPQPNSLAPFSCQYSPQVPELLTDLGCSIAITTYQAGKLIFISPKDKEHLVQLPRTFDKPMGLARDGGRDKLALACRDEIIVFSQSAQLARHYPKAPGKYDALYMPRLTYHTGPLDIHDLYFGKDRRLFAVNTLFSCVMTVDDDYNFTPYWKPPFISHISSDDRCHLNGMAMHGGLPKYVSAFNQGNTRQSWRAEVTTGGIIMDVENNEIVAEGLAMPHSPRLFGGQLYVLLSATGELLRINPATGQRDIVTRLGGFVRGMSMHKDYLFIGLSKLRRNSSTFAKLEMKHKSDRAGIAIVHLPTGSLAGRIEYLRSVDEIYDVHIIPDRLRPNIMNTARPDHKMGLSIPGSTFWAASPPK